MQDRARHLPNFTRFAGGGTLFFDAEFLSAHDADAALRTLCAEVPLEQKSIVLFGRSVMQPRLVAWMGDPGAVYTYSGLTQQPLPWHPLVKSLAVRVSAIAGVTFNSVLLNLYRDGHDSMGFHADDERELGPHPIIASVSLGVSRTFVLKPRRARTSTEPVRLTLTHGSLLVMGGTLQRDFHHGVPKELRVTQPRLNLTFRQILTRG